MKIGILANPRKYNVSSVLKKLTAKLDSLSVDYRVSQNYSLRSDVLNDNDDLREIFELSDVIVALGGDGTIIHTAKIAAMYSKPVLGINSGHTGFMAGIEPNELDLIEKLINGEYYIEDRMMFKVTVSSHPNEVRYCLNDVVLSKGSMDYAFDINLFNSSKKFMSFRADGLILSTPTGSTAYAMSAGGPVTDPSIECMELVPICPISLFSRGFILSGDSEIDIRIKTRNNVQVFINFDGRDGFGLTDKDIVTVKKAGDVVTRLIKIKNDSFYDVIKNKLSAI